MESQYKRLINNIESFVRKYYVNLLIRGALYTTAITLGVFLVIDLLEYFLYLPGRVKLVIVLLYLLVSAFTIVYFILIPLLRLFGVIPKISHEKAALIIGMHFPEIQDKLLNTIQLFEQKKAGTDKVSLKLLNASIEQRAMKLSPFKFGKAVNFYVNKKYLKWAMPPLLIILVLIISAPKTIINPTERFINYDSTYYPPPPFKFVLVNKDLSVKEGDDFQVRLKIKGETIPENVSINVGGFDYLMKKESTVEFGHILRKVTQPVDFYFVSGKYRSPVYSLKMINSPKILKIAVQVVYPAYLHKKPEELRNLTDLSIPEGSDLSFDIATKHVAGIDVLVFDKKLASITPASGGRFLFSRKKIRKSADYQFVPKNKEVKVFDTLNYHLEIIKDEFPQIRVSEFTDSVFEKRKFFKGLIKDDHGFTALYFTAKYKNKSGRDTISKARVSFSHGVQSQDFLYSVDLAKIPYLPGSAITYYFTVYDNDGVNGPKSSDSRRFSVLTKTREDEINSIEKDEENIRKSVDSKVKKAQELSLALERMSNKLREKKDLSWEDRKQIKEILKKYKELEKSIEKERIKQQINNLKRNEVDKESEDIRKKQEQLNKLMEELMTPEMKKLMEEMRKMMEKNVKKEDVEKALEKMKFDSDYLKEQLDRDLEIMKQLKFDQKLQQAIDKIEELQKAQKKLTEESKEKNADAEKLKARQDSLNKEFEKFEKMMKEARKANEELEKPNTLEDTKQEESEIKQEMRKSSESLSKGKKKSAGKSQQNAAAKMKQLSEKLQEMQEAMQSEGNSEDINNLENILQNLVEISFNQERLMKKVKVTSNRDPQFPKFVEEQKNISNDLSMVEDSLRKLSRRNPSVSPFINREIKNIQRHSEKTFRELKDMNTIAPASARQMNKAAADQQFIMTSVNNLALMLSEALDQIKKQQMQKSGKGSCNKPKPGQGGSMKSIRQMQQALQKQMEQMKKQMEKGGMSQGKNGKQAQNGEKMSEEFSKMAAQQEAIRRKLQQYREQLAKEGKLKQAGKLGKIGDQMEKNETDLVNKILTAESLMRQKEILTRLLESEKAEREQKQKEERKSEVGKNRKNSNKNLFLKYKEQRSEDMELLRSIPAELKPFYKKLVESYFSN